MHESDPMMYPYAIYGLDISSEVRLLGVAPGGAAQDVVIRRGEVQLPSLQRGLSGILFHVEQDTVFFRWERVGSFRIRGGREVVVTPDPQVDDLVLQRFMLGPVLAAVLHQRRRLILHASAVALPMGAVAFLGESGSGKSTLAAHFHARGCPLIADDIVAIQVEQETHLVYPGVPEIRLWPDSVSALGEDPDDFPTELPGSAKRVWTVDDKISPQPLARVYLFEEGDRHEILPVPPAEAAIALVRYTYGVRLLLTIDPVAHFHHCMAIARTVPTCRLRRHLALERLPELLTLIEDDLAYGH